MEPHKLDQNKENPTYPRVPIQPKTPGEIEKKSLGLDFSDEATSKDAPQGDFTHIGEERETQLMEPAKPRAMIPTDNNAEVIAAHERLVKKSAEEGIIFDPERGFIVEKENFDGIASGFGRDFPAPAPKEEDSEKDSEKDPEDPNGNDPEGGNPEEERDKWDEI